VVATKMITTTVADYHGKSHRGSGYRGRRSIL
jgi:hypothetical protein